MTNLLCAADIYVQPGTQSVTMQQSLCCRCVVILDKVKSHYPYVNENGWLIQSQEELNDIINSIDKVDLSKMQRKSFKIACKLLNYVTLSKRITN